MSPPRHFQRTALCLLLLLPVGVPAFSAPGDAPARDRQEIDDAVNRLGSADPAERDAAARVLWSKGEAAQDALKEAAGGDDIEAARRAQDILARIRYGVRPETPQGVQELVQQYRQSVAQGTGQVVPASITGLASAGPEGLRILARLWRDEADGGRRRLISQALAERSRGGAASMLAQGNFADALEVLEAAADAASPWGEPAVRDLAALLLLRDGGVGLDGRVAKLKPLVADTSLDAPARARSARLLAYLLRARGDLPAARWAAERAGEPALLELLLAESAQWKEMAARAMKRPNLDDSVEDLGYAAAYHRLAGDAAGLDALAAKMVALADRRPDEAAGAAESLFLNDRPDAGVGVLLKHKAYAEASELMAPRLRFDELAALATRARAEKDTDAPVVEARAAAARYTLGDAKGAGDAVQRLVGEAAERKGGPADATHYAVLAEVAAAVGRADLADECAARGVTLGNAIRNDEYGDLLEAAGFGPGERAARWWRTLREKYKEPVRITLGRLRSLTRGELTAAQTEALARAAADTVLRTEPGTREDALADIGDALTDLGQREAAASYFKWLSQRPPVPPVAFIRLGDFEASEARWDAAATMYGKAWELDRTQALPLLLRGAALTHIGREKEGAELAALAHLLPLADEAARHALLVELDKRQMPDDARRERDLLLRTASFQSWHASDALRRAGDEAYEKEDYLVAAGLWDRAFLDNQSRSIHFARLWANFAMPALIHRSRALGLMRSGDLGGAAREADLAMNYSPSDTDSLIAFVNELDRLGKQAEADALYRKYSATYRSLCEAHPDSAQLHNQLAWAQAKCKRDLDDALAHAKRAAELDPKSTAILDTLAETHFQRGEIQKAIELMNRCAEMEPKEKRHQEQLERFNKALRGK